MKILIFLVSFLLVANLASAAHYIVGKISDARDGTPANNHVIMLWKNSTADNLTDIIGPSGNSGANNIYMLDCEMLKTPCKMNDILHLRVLSNSDNHVSENFSVTVTGSAYDIANFILNSPPNVTSINVDDSISFPLNEIDLSPGSKRTVYCNAIINDLDGEDGIKTIESAFYDAKTGFYSQEDNSSHYSNNSCYIDKSYGNSDQIAVNCTYSVLYYANSTNWNCTVRATDNASTSSNNTALTFINPLLSIEIPSTTIDFGDLGMHGVSNESTINISNRGNVAINLSIAGYAISPGDGIAMTCDSGERLSNISVYYEKFNLSSSNPQDLTLSDFEQLYQNVSSQAKVKRFDLSKEYTLNPSSKNTYWRIYAPSNAQGNCTGNIIIGAVQAPEN